MKSTHYVVVLAALAMSLVFAPAARAGVNWTVGFGSPGFHFSLGYGDYGAYSDLNWYDPYWSIDLRYLDGYGRWVYVDHLGSVWVPYVATAWRPYTYGRWIYTSLGWTWVAYEPWGYLTHHYGHWALTPYGWAWVPGYDYRPAAVAWVSFGGYVGWYPTPPRGWCHYHRAYHRHGHGYRAGYHRGYRDGYHEGWHDAQYASYVAWRDLTSDSLGRHVRSRAELRGVSDGDFRAFSQAPAREEVERRTGARIRQLQVEERSAKWDSRAVRVVRPEGAKTSIERNWSDSVTRALSADGTRELMERQRRVQQGQVGERDATRRWRGDEPTGAGSQQERRAVPGFERGEVRRVEPRSDRTEIVAPRRSEARPDAAGRSRQPTGVLERGSTAGGSRSSSSAPRVSAGDGDSFRRSSGWQRPAPPQERSSRSDVGGVETESRRRQQPVTGRAPNSTSRSSGRLSRSGSDRSPAPGRVSSSRSRGSSSAPSVERPQSSTRSRVQKSREASRSDRGGRQRARRSRDRD